MKVKFKGKIIYQLNDALIEKQNIDGERLSLLIQAYKTKYVLCKTYNKFLKDCKTVESKIELAKKFYRMAELNELDIQRLWGFDEDKSKIKFWTLPGCTCPTMDNEDMYDTDNVVHSLTCLVHGDNNVI